MLGLWPGSRCCPIRYCPIGAPRPWRVQAERDELAAQLAATETELQNVQDNLEQAK